MRAVVVFGPAGTGKTRNAETMRRQFNCARVVDGWSAGQPIAQGDLVLTNAHPGPVPPGVQVLPIAEALRRIGSQRRTDEPVVQGDAAPPATNFALAAQCELLAQRLRNCRYPLATLQEYRNDSVVAPKDLDEAGLAASQLLDMLVRMFPSQISQVPSRTAPLPSHNIPLPRTELGRAVQAPQDPNVEPTSLPPSSAGTGIVQDPGSSAVSGGAAGDTGATLRFERQGATIKVTCSHGVSTVPIEKLREPVERAVAHAWSFDVACVSAPGILPHPVEGEELRALWRLIEESTGVAS